MSFSLVNKDCIKFIRELKINGAIEIFDAVITDPPYNISRLNNFKTIKRAGIDFGSWDYGFNQTEWIYEVSPLVKKGGSIIIFNDYKNFGEITEALEKSGFEVKDLLRWVKNNPMPRNTSRRYVTDYEFAIWATKIGGKWTFNKPDNKPYIRPEFKYPIVANGRDKIHPTQKSVKLLDDILDIHTNENDVVFDPFMGSGTTGVSSLLKNRIFVGCEIDRNYFHKAFDRLSLINNNRIANKNVLRSPLYYLGDKYKLLPQIIDKIPSNIEKFYDVFGGGGTMLANISAEEYFYNDINKHLVSVVEHIFKNPFVKLKKEINDIIKKFNLSEGNKNDNGESKYNYNSLKEYYNKLQKNEKYDTSSLILFVLIIYGFNSQIRFNSRGEFNIPIGKQGFNKHREQNLKKFQSSIQSKKITFTNEDFEEYINKIIDSGDYKNSFVYLDPPYSITKATYNNSWNSNDDLRLFAILDKLTELKVKWALSNVFVSNGNENKELIKWTKKQTYNVIFLNYSYKNSNYRRKNLSEDREVLITNYENW